MSGVERARRLWVAIIKAVVATSITALMYSSMITLKCVNWARPKTMKIGKEHSVVKVRRPEVSEAQSACVPALNQLDVGPLVHVYDVDRKAVDEPEIGRHRESNDGHTQDSG